MSLLLVLPHGQHPEGDADAGRGGGRRTESMGAPQSTVELLNPTVLPETHHAYGTAGSIIHFLLFELVLAESVSCKQKHSNYMPSFPEGLDLSRLRAAAG